jgi:hypothetical protein
LARQDIEYETPVQKDAKAHGEFIASSLADS